MGEAMGMTKKQMIRVTARTIYFEHLSISIDDVTAKRIWRELE